MRRPKLLKSAFLSFVLLFTFFSAEAFGPTPPTKICQGSVAMLSASTKDAAGYQWYYNGQVIAGAFNQKYAASNAGTYKVVAFNAQSCASEASDEITIEVESSVSINFPALADKTVGDAPFKLNATSARAITYTASPAGIVSISQDIVTILAPGEVTITATADGTNSCGNAIVTTQTLKVNAVTPVAAMVDLAIAATSDSKPVTTEQPFQYTLSIKNQSKVTATNVSVTDTLPDALDFVSVNQATGVTAAYDPATRLVSWKMEKMEASAYTELSFSVKAVKHGGIKNTVKVASAEQDSNPANNVAVDYKDVSGISVPNVFTPNGDGKNDAFVIADIGNYTENQLVVLNRWGTAVYQAKNYQNNWTGDNLDEGTYFYSLRVKNNKGEQEEYKGYVTLLRKNI